MLKPSSHTALLMIALAICSGLALSQLAPPPTNPPLVEWLAKPRPVAGFILRSDDGEFGLRQLRGQWDALILGFTHCPDLCPTTLAELAALRKTLQTAVKSDSMRIVFVSIDPLRDTPKALAAYVNFFADDIIGITGADHELRALASSLGMDFRREGPAENPRISHSPTIALIAPDGFLHGRLRPGFNTQQAAREVSARIGNDS
jgi:protein SCO1